MGTIRVLDAHVVNQIAAGEVVDRPASVVKELVENALDAGARRIDVRLEDGGKALIEVADDGLGMDPDDLALAFAAHATSKVRDVADLEHVASLGFRGEALPSIGSVSRARITSRCADASAGAMVENLEGRLSQVRPAAASAGTVVRVEHLFGQVPARRKFLRTAATELGHVVELLERFAVAWPDVGLRLEHAGRVLLEVSAGESRRERIERVHGAEVARALLEVRAPDGVPALEGWVSPPTLTRGDGRLEQTFLNGRHVRDRTLAHALKEAYRDLLPPGGRRPIAFLFLSCDPALVDVNVHPAKAEVRWRDASAAHDVVRRAVRAVLERARPGAPVVLSTGSTADAGGSSTPQRVEDAVEFAFTRGVGRAADGGFPRATGAWTAAGWGTGAPDVHQHSATCGGLAPADGSPERDQTHEPKGGGLRAVGQALGTYLLFEGPDELVLVDQHALHERVLFERINARLRQGGRLEVQTLLVPTIVEVGAAGAARLLEQRDLLQRLGWQVEAFGTSSVAVHGVPAVLRPAAAAAALGEALELLERGRAEGLDRTALLSSAVDRLACRAAVMAGDSLHPEEALELLAQSEALNHAHSCPHGRPTRLTLTKRDLERWFHRTV